MLLSVTWLPHPPHPQDNVVEDTMSVDPKHHRYFVARRGQVLRDIADEYGGVMVSFPRTGSQSEKVTLKGAKDCVEAAKKRMQEIIEDLVSGRRAAPSKHGPVVTVALPKASDSLVDGRAGQGSPVALFPYRYQKFLRWCLKGRIGYRGVRKSMC